MSLAPLPERRGATEWVIARVRPHARVLFWPTVLLLAVCAALGFFGGSFALEWQNLAVLGLAAAVVVVGWLMPLLFWLAHSYTITSRRTILRHGVFVRTRQEVLHGRVIDVTVRRGALQTLVGTGDVVLNVGTHEPVELRDVPSPNLVADALHELVERSRPDNSVG